MSFRRWLMVILGCGAAGVLAGMFLALAPSPGGPEGDRNASASLLASLVRGATGCTAMPPAGSTAALDRGTLRREGVDQGIVRVSNALGQANVVLVMSQPSGQQVQMLTAGPGGFAQVPMPTGTYQYAVMFGRQWCSIARGFTDGRKSTLTIGAGVERNQTLHVSVHSGDTPEALHVRYTQEPHAVQRVTRDTLELRRSGPGYIAVGTVNSVRVPMVVDTGASVFTVPQELASQAGIRCEVERLYATASGTVKGCLGRAYDMSFGPFRLTNVEVAVVPGGDHVLLGMNVLRQFQMVWSDDTVRISPRSGAQLSGAAPVTEEETPAVAYYEPRGLVAGQLVPALLISLGIAVVVVAARRRLAARGRRDAEAGMRIEEISAAFPPSRS